MASGDIPNARERLRAVAHSLHNVSPDRGEEIHLIVDTLLYRQKRAKPTAEPTRRKMTGPLVCAIEAELARDPTQLVDDIGAKFGVAGGRVTDVAQGRRCRVTGKMLPYVDPLS